MSEATPTVVLVHGAFADASSWNGVIERLQAKGIPVIAPRRRSRYCASRSPRSASRARTSTLPRTRPTRPLLPSFRDMRSSV
jgi:hypothetical protein